MKRFEVIRQMRTQDGYTVKELCAAFDVSRSGFYAHGQKAQRTRRQQDARLAEQIGLFFVQSRQTYGCRRLQHQLRREGIRCGKTRIRRLMNQGQLQALQKRRFRVKTTQSRHELPVAPNRLGQRGEPPQRPNQVWTADITYLPTQEGSWLYLAAEMDLCSKRIAGWKLDDSLATPLVVGAFERAVRAWSTAPELHHSDRGVQYAAASFRDVLQTHHVEPSMSRKACCYDNAAMESFFATLKTECFHDRLPRDRAEAQAMLFDYIETFYNPHRLHSALDYRSPLEFENHLRQKLNQKS